MMLDQVAQEAKHRGVQCAAIDGGFYFFKLIEHDQGVSFANALKDAQQEIVFEGLGWAGLKIFQNRRLNLKAAIL